MNIFLSLVGTEYDPYFIDIWSYFFEKSKTKIKPILFYTDIYPSNWKWEKNKFPINIVSDIIKESIWSKGLSKWPIIDLYKLSVCKYYDSCIILDFDCIIKKQLDNYIPDCEWGICQYSKFSNYFNPIQYPANMINFDFDFFRWCNNGVQIITKNFFDDVVKEFKKQLDRIHKFPFIEAFIQDVISYIHRKNNGVYLQNEWNWYPFSKICNNDILIEHYYGTNNKERLRQIYENSIAN